MLDRAKFYKVCGKEWLFPSIQDAVHHARFGDTLVSLGLKTLVIMSRVKLEITTVSDIPVHTFGFQI